MQIKRRVAGVELGGTKSIALLAEGGTICEQVSVQTTTPDVTLGLLRDKLAEWSQHQRLDAIGIASFGPIGLTLGTPEHGCMLKTPKPHWTGAPVAARLTEGFDCPWMIDTDVNGAALAEYRWGAGQGCSSVCYVTIGTGVGGGLVVEGRPIHGAMHPELGHIRIRRADGDEFPGACPFHGDCVEGLICGPALAERFDGPPADVSDSHPVWAHVASDIAELIGTILLTVSPQRVLIGGGVGAARAFLLQSVRDIVVKRLNGYLPFVTRESVADIIRPPGLGDMAGPRGAIALALQAIGA